jgi:hypothetical protein
MIAAGGCTSPSGKTGSHAVVSVSAVNYSALSDREIFDNANGQTNTSPESPPHSKQERPVYYLMLPGEVDASDVRFDSLYHQLGASLEHRGYYSALAQVKAGRPLKLDYLLRVHYGIKPWLTPTVRSDRVTWGNDGLLAKRYKSVMLSNTDFDPRAGLSQAEVDNMAQLSLKLMSSKGSNGTESGDSLVEARQFTQDQREATSSGEMTGAAYDFCFVVVEAFRFADVKAMDTKAPCAWMIFIAVPNDDDKLKFSRVLPSMLKTAELYYGTTTNGMQVHEVPLGTVKVGEPVEVQPVAPANNPSLNFRQ